MTLLYCVRLIRHIAPLLGKPEERFNWNLETDKIMSKVVFTYFIDGDVWQCSEWSYLLTKLPVSSQWVKVLQTCIMHPNFNWRHLIHFNNYLHWCLLIDSFSSISLFKTLTSSNIAYLHVWCKYMHLCSAGRSWQLQQTLRLAEAGVHQQLWRPGDCEDPHTPDIPVPAVRAAVWKGGSFVIIPFTLPLPCSLI